MCLLHVISGYSSGYTQTILSGITWAALQKVISSNLYLQWETSCSMTRYYFAGPVFLISCSNLGACQAWCIQTKCFLLKSNTLLYWILQFLARKKKIKKWVLIPLALTCILDFFSLNNRLASCFPSSVLLSLSYIHLVISSWWGISELFSPFSFFSFLNHFFDFVVGQTEAFWGSEDDTAPLGSGWRHGPRPALTTLFPCGPKNASDGPIPFLATPSGLPEHLDD